MVLHLLSYSRTDNQVQKKSYTHTHTHAVLMKITVSNKMRAVGKFCTCASNKQSMKFLFYD